jgi:AraC-like DNA-binding protein
MKSKYYAVNWRANLKDKEADFIDEDLFLFNNPLLLPAFDYPVKMDIPLTVLCSRGTIKVSVNLKDYTIEAPAIFIVVSGKIVQYKSVSDDFSGFFMLMSKKFLTDLLSGPRERLPIFLSVLDSPLVQLTNEDLASVNDFYLMLQKEIRQTMNPYRLETVRHLVQAMFYSTGYKFHKTGESSNKTKHEILMEEFINLVKAHYRKEREVGFYAMKLKLTPKYLSKLIRDNSNKSVNEWINDYVLLEAKALLKSTNMTIQQISDELNFPSQSFFGKYFKRLVGASPKEYRKK